MAEHLDSPIAFDFTVSPERECYLEEQLTEFNKAHFALWEQNHDSQYIAAPLHVFALDSHHAVVGGLVGRTHRIRAWLEVSLLWVSEAWRGRGLGRALMQRAEEEARGRGCLYARLATSGFQAPGFYEKLGYCVYGQLENCPPGDTVFYYRKDLRQSGE
jgi:GNAT superfamily N-acetyltransferase